MRRAQYSFTFGSKHLSTDTFNDLSTMKTTAVLINTSRAELIEAGALIAALNRKLPGIAAIGIYESELIYEIMHY